MWCTTALHLYTSNVTMQLFWLRNYCRIIGKFHLRQGGTVREILGCEIRNGKAVEARSVDTRVAHTTQRQLSYFPPVWALRNICDDGVWETGNHDIILKENKRQQKKERMHVKLQHSCSSSKVSHFDRNIFDGLITTSFLWGTSPWGREKKKKCSD